MKSIEDLLYGLMAQAEDTQNAATELLAAAKSEMAAARDIRKDVMGALRSEARGEIREILKQELKGASEGLQGLSEGVREAVSSQVSLAHDTERNIRGAWWRHTLFLVLVGSLIAGGLWMFQDFAIEQAKKERAALKREITELEAQAKKLGAKTWGIELIEWRDGQRGILLPKGVHVQYTGKADDGRDAIVVTTPR
uniref:Mobilization protein n=1 Tax=uncultured prokaryote TaxID=198431 RepID=A0A0H5PWY6_9ZZZZ|nr:unnamed protein product [uncultured bacterium]CRY93695.1 hypothetical protein [uncultured prokaryote]